MSAPRAEMPAMREYGVGGPNWSALPWSWAAKRLASSRNFWLVTVSAGGRPHALPVWGVWHDGDQRFFFSCAPSSRKRRNLEADPRCVVGNEDTVECVSMEGTARAVDPAHADVWIGRYLDKYAPLAPGLDAEFIRRNAMFEFRPEVAFAIIEREDEFANRATRWRFDA